MANKQTHWYHGRKWAAAIVVLSLITAYAIASLAIDSGNLFQYALVIGLLVLAINRLAHLALMGLGKASR